jgi:putative phosphoesterase
MKIGVISDTHIPGRNAEPPVRIAEVFKGLDIILHVGDVCELFVLEAFQETYTLTFAVHGESDSPEVKQYLEEMRVVRFGERRVAMIHGHQIEAHLRARAGLRSILGWKPKPEAVPEFLIGQFAEDDVHAIIFGHTHRPYVKMYKGVLLFNPGAAVPGPNRRASVGILNMEKRIITGKVVFL